MKGYKMSKYTINSAPKNMNCAHLIGSGYWDNAEVALINNVRPESGPNQLDVSLRLLYDNSGIYGRFEVKNDQYMRCMADRFQYPVCTDSCVEFFIKPNGNDGYINFEFSAAGELLCSHIVDHTRTADGFADFRLLTKEEAAGVIIASTLPKNIEEICEKMDWELGFFIPFTVFEKLNFTKPTSTELWRGNFYKCGDKTRYPHWITWSEVDELNFHLPKKKTRGASGNLAPLYLGREWFSLGYL